MKRCPRCGLVKPHDEFYRRSAACRSCEVARVRTAQERRRAEIGDEAYRAEQAEYRRRARSKPGGRTRGVLYERAKYAAMRALAQAHPDEFDALFTQELVLHGLPAEPYVRTPLPSSPPAPSSASPPAPGG